MKPDTMRVAILTGRMQMEIGTQPIPELPPGGMLIKVNCCGLCGSDINRVRFTTSSQPRILGHEVAGDVVAVDSGVTKFKVGDRVVIGHVHVPCFTCSYCRHGSYTMCRQFKGTRIIPGGYAEYVAIPADQTAHTVFRIPDELSYEEATFLDPLSCCLRALRRAVVHPLDRVVVIGAGIMGALFVQLLRLMEVESFILDISTPRLERAKVLGATHVFNSKDPNAIQSIRTLTQDEGADVVIPTFMNQDILNQSLQMLRDGGPLLVFAPPAVDQDYQLNIGALFYRELNILTCYSSAPEDLETALKWIASGKVDVKHMITGHTDLAGIVPAIAGMDEHTYKIIVQP